MNPGSTNVQGVKLLAAVTGSSGGGAEGDDATSVFFGEGNGVYRVVNLAFFLRSFFQA